MKRSYRGAIWFVTVGVLLVCFMGCKKKKEGTEIREEYAFRAFFTPRKLSIGESTNSIFVVLSSTDQIDAKHHTELHQQMVKEYDLPKCQVYSSAYKGLPKKPINIKSIKVYLQENETTKKDVSDRFEIIFDDLKAYLAQVRDLRLLKEIPGYNVRTVKLSELTENDLKWLSDAFTLQSPIANRPCLTLQIEVEGEPTIIKKL